MQLALLHYVHSLVPPAIPVLLVADTAFEDGDVQKQLQAWAWFYVLRQKPNNSVTVTGQWTSLGTLTEKPGRSVWLPSVELTEKHQLTTNVLAYWKRREERPWLLATNLPSQHNTLKAYQWRMWIEEMHGDLKPHGFYLEDSHLLSFTRLSRLAFAVVLLYLWILLEGAQVIKNGKRRFVDRHDRRDLCVFQIGWRWMERCLTSAHPISFSSFAVPVIKLSGS